MFTFRETNFDVIFFSVLTRSIFRLSLTDYFLGSYGLQFNRTEKIHYTTTILQWNYSGCGRDLSPRTTDRTAVNLNDIYLIPLFYLFS